MVLAAFLCLLLSGPAWAGPKVFECRAADGHTRLTNKACLPGETISAERALPTRTPTAPDFQAAAEAAEGTQAAPPKPPGTTGSLRWTVRNLLVVNAWTEGIGWRALRAVSDSERATVRRAVEEFNRLEGLRLKLDYVEEDAEEALLQHQGAQDGRIEITWAEDAKAGGLPPPYMWRDKSYVTLGAARMAKAEGLSETAPPGTLAGQASSGGKVWLIEFSERIRGLYKCKADGPLYVTLHELGHALGLGHDTPAPSIMHGTCGTAYFPNDLAGFRYYFAAH